MKAFLTISIFLLSPGLLASEYEEETVWVEVGDMIVDEAQIVPDDFVSERGFKQKKDRLWPEGVLPITFSNKINAKERKEFMAYCKEMGRYADVSCEPRENQDRDYLYVDKTTRKFCGSSQLGKKGGRQKLLIRCWRKRTIQHELMHALGIFHEHNRMDRDEHIEILWDNMKSGSRWNYSKISSGKISHALSFYDYDSIMHYSSYQGSRNKMPVFYRIDKGPQKGVMATQAQKMSYGDHLILWLLYGGTRPRK